MQYIAYCSPWYVQEFGDAHPKSVCKYWFCFFINFETKFQKALSSRGTEYAKDHKVIKHAFFAKHL